MKTERERDQVVQQNGGRKKQKEELIQAKLRETCPCGFHSGKCGHGHKEASLQDSTSQDEDLIASQSNQSSLEATDVSPVLNQPEMFDEESVSLATDEQSGPEVECVSNTDEEDPRFKTPFTDEAFLCNEDSSDSDHQSENSAIDFLTEHVEIAEVRSPLSVDNSDPGVDPGPGVDPDPGDDSDPCSDSDPGDDSEPEDGSIPDPDDPVGGFDDGDSFDSSNSDDDNFNLNQQSLNARLSCVRPHTVKEAIVLNLANCVRHNWTYEALISNMVSLNTLLGMKLLPTSKKQLWRVINRTSAGINSYAYCNSCINYLGKLSRIGEEIQCLCGFLVSKKKAKYFVTLSLRKQLKNFLATPHVAELLRFREQRQKRDPTTIEDIYDGQEYRKLQGEGQILSPSNNYSYVFNTDGFRLGKSSKLTAWPLFIRLNELPPNLRQKHRFLAALWIDVKEPNMLTFLRPFVAQANDLSSRGIVWKPDGVNEVCSLFIPTCKCVDAKARCALLNMAQYNGYYGCTFCDHKGVPAGGSMKYPILPHNTLPQPAIRTDESIRRAMRESAETRSDVKGVKGPSELMNLDYSNLFSGCAMDDLHPIYEGVTQFHTDLLLKVERGDLSTAQRVVQIDSRLTRIKPPSCIARKPAPISKRGQWHGTEWRNWLLYYCIPCFQNLIPQRYINHIELLAHGVFLLSQDVINDEEIDMGHRSFVKYVELFEEFFGIENMRYNVHQLTHVSQSVQNWGPLLAYSTFSFESWNHRLMKCVTSPKAAMDQIVTRHLMTVCVASSVHSDNDTSQEVRDQISSIMFKPRHKNIHQVGSVYVLGSSNRRMPLNAEVVAFQREGFAFQFLFEYERLLIGNTVYCSVHYGAPDWLSDNTSIYTWDDTFCTVQNIVVSEHDGNEVCGMFVTEHDVEKSMTYAKHIARIRRNAELFHFLPITKVRSPALKVSVLDDVYIMPISNQHEID